MDRVAVNHTRPREKRIDWKAALAASSSLGMALFAACSDSPVAPVAAKVTPAGPSFVVGEPAGATPVPGKLIVCKAGNIGGDFTVARSAGSGSFDDNGLHLDQGQCVVVAEDFSPQGFGSVFRVHEISAPNVTFVVTGVAIELGFPQTTLSPPPSDNQEFFINSIHGIRITYTNTFTPPATGCTFTKGWYQSKNATLTGVDGLTVQMEAAFFAATPNKTGSVSFVGPNNLLNLYQQLLAALENGGANGPQAVKDAIADAQAGTSVSAGGQLTTTLTDQEISDLINTLTAFNEGTLPGWPHCAD